MANEICLNVGKTDLVLFRFKQIQIQSDIWEFKILTWKQHINHVALQLNEVNAMLSKLRQVLDIKTLRSIYYAISESHLSYASLVWAQNTKSVKSLHLLQKKSLIIMFFESWNSHTGSLFKVFEILKSFDETALENCIFIIKSKKDYWLLFSTTDYEMIM